ncbi:fluoride efflux transporter CrcB [Kocuria palustris]|uniref:fluoride efflux transporter CrcB n=1 Tax=Kocuria palustris TaxID=71999 RepID=UPI0011A478F0|nr:fluoride efflux transporter CrcB [Kocuria palustris]
MTPLLLLGIAAAGGLGAVARFVLDGFLRAALPSRLPWPTLLINGSGSLALGLLAGLAARLLVPEAWELILGTGFLGGFTTFSTASAETVRLLQDRRWAAAAAHSLGMLAVAVAAAGAGLALGLGIGTGGGAGA